MFENVDSFKIGNYVLDCGDSYNGEVGIVTKISGNHVYIKWIIVKRNRTKNMIVQHNIRSAIRQYRKITEDEYLARLI